MIHNTTCQTDFPENMTIHDLRREANKIVMSCVRLGDEKDRHPTAVADDLCEIIDSINELKQEHLQKIYPIFEKFDNLQREVKKLPK